MLLLLLSFCCYLNPQFWFSKQSRINMVCAIFTITKPTKLLSTKTSERTQAHRYALNCDNYYVEISQALSINMRTPRTTGDNWKLSLPLQHSDEVLSSCRGREGESPGCSNTLELSSGDQPGWAMLLQHFFVFLWKKALPINIRQNTQTRYTISFYARLVSWYSFWSWKIQLEEINLSVS